MRDERCLTVAAQDYGYYVRHAHCPGVKASDTHECLASLGGDHSEEHCPVELGVLAYLIVRAIGFSISVGLPC